MLRSTFAGFTTAQHALMASQYAIDVAGQNIANMETPGYTRQRLDVSSITPTGPSNANSMYDTKIGQGVLMEGVLQIRDPYLDIQYRNQLAKVGTVDAMDGVLEKLGSIFDETDSTAVRAALNDVISQLKTMAETPNAGENSMDVIVRSSFEVLLNIVNQNATSLDDLRSETDILMQDTLVPNVNDILYQITELNKQIKKSEILGSPALELKDERNLLIDDLATYLPIEVKYTDIMDEPKVQELTISFKTTGIPEQPGPPVIPEVPGETHVLVQDDVYGRFEYDNVSTDTVFDYQLQIFSVQPDGSLAAPLEHISNQLANGVLKGNLDMLNKSGDFDTPASDVKGIGYYEKQFDSFVQNLAYGMNYLNAEKDPDTGEILTDPVTGELLTHDLFEPVDPTKPMSSSNIQVSEAWMKGEVSLNKTFELGPDGELNSTAYENILSMVNHLSSDTKDFRYYHNETPTGGVIIDPLTGMPNNVTTSAAFNGTIQEAYDNIQNIQAIERKSNTIILENRISVLNQITDSKMAVSSVSQDEETMNLMRYQQSYSAASRLVTTLDEMLDKLINGTGVVGR